MKNARQVVGELVLLVLGDRARPGGLVALEVDRVRRPRLALPQLVELLRVHQLDRAELRLVGDRADVALGGEVEKVAMAGSHPGV